MLLIHHERKVLVAREQVARLDLGIDGRLDLLDEAIERAVEACRVGDVDAELDAVDDPADPHTAGDSRGVRARIVPGAGGGDGGLFAGILVRYLALVATDLPDGPGAGHTRARAAQMVLDTAEAVWQGRAIVDGAPLFSADWRTPAVIPTASGTDAQFIAGAVHSSETPERDLSVQLSGWMALEAAARVAGGLSEY